MSNMRDFNMQNNVSEEIRPESDALSEGETHSLGEFHVIETEEASSTGRVLGALAVALLLGTAGGYAYYTSQKAPAAPVANQVAAVAPAPAAAPAQTADTSAPAAPAPSEAAPSSPAPQISQPVSQPASAPAPTASRRVRAARADTSAAPAQMQAVTTEPNAPTVTPDQNAAVQPSSNPSLARNEQNGADVTAPASEAPAVQPPATPTPAATPAPAAQPAPAAPADQPAAQ